MKKFPGSICIRQRIAASYRRPFFDLIADRCEGSVTVLAGQPDSNLGEGVGEFDQLSRAKLIRVDNVYKGSGPIYRYFQPKLTEHLSALRPDVLVSEASPRFVDTQKTIKRVHSLGGIVAGWGAGTTDFWNKPLKRLRKWYRNRNLKNFDGMLCYSTLAAKQYQQVGYTEQQTHVLFNSTMPRPESATAPDRPGFQSPAKLLFIGRLIDTKGIDRLIRASSIAQDKGIRLETWIVGDGPHSDALKKLSASMNAPVKFLGRKTGDDLKAVSREADLFVLPGLGGLAIQEAMSHGLPVIVTEADGTERDLVKTNGWIAKKEDTEELANCIIEALSNSAELRSRGKESYRIVRDEINLDLMADRFVNAVAIMHEKSRAGSDSSVV